jgi:hypothetical protein
MAKEIINEETGEVEIFYTKEELDAQLAEKDIHVQAKLEEFKTGKQSQELKEIERQKAIEEAQKKAEEAMNMASQTKEDARKKVVNFFAEQFVGEDTELKTKLNDSFSLIEEGRKAKGLDISSDEAIKEMMQQASLMSGLSNNTPVFPIGGGMAPNFQKTKDELSDQDHQTFMKEVGYTHPAPPKAE